MYNLPPWLCKHCWSGMPYEKPTGKIGLFGGAFGEWLAGEIGDISWLQWLVRRDCENCGGTGEVEYRRPDLPYRTQLEANAMNPYPPAPPMNPFITTKEIIDAARRQSEKTVSQQCLEPIEDIRPIYGMHRK